ncbi:YhcN/YlaJ family sporulation lipoprotein [Salipaludibacillus aurantiacus]|uniref:Sporulation lipoprotein YhcN/YlaJ (Spore_YhcN_YlaJ) n=1 Tax=Salipaludibacillus aurantiacus TaxID=1601833 RepID=A0A1H9RKZ2_9BACI|nr:YhcN/YlaJ family sporulation lipoprotein [Salipaludibacillus aurantiacus]SER73334.1 Sporulation lipoprotein YhcN/YlaJ (Spore_YhcN_YlaJ) [Salipaludibacillus aurantiacus]
MKKMTLCLSLATLMFTGITGCGDMDNANNVEGQRFGGQNRYETGFDGQRMDGTGMGSANYGQRGMMGRETERYGMNTPGGQDQMTGYQGAANQRGGMFGKGQGRGRFGGQQGFADGRGGFFGRGQGGRGFTGGFSRGITGNDRPGMVDSNGLINGRLRGLNRTEGFTQTEGFNQHQADGQLNRGTRGQMDGMAGRTQQQGGRGYFDTDEGRTARKIENRVEDIEGVRDANVIVRDNDVVIAVEARGNNEQIEDEVRSLVANMDDDNQIFVVTERSGVERIQGMEDRLRDGQPFEEVGATFNAMLDDLGDAIQRPFERTR